MSNETKWDLFEALADDCAGLNDELYEDLLRRYDAALPDNIVMLPARVGDYIKWCKGDGGIGNVLDAMQYATDYVEGWLLDERNSDFFARAWLLGIWRVEETSEIVKLEAEK
jgi:hypothetical protein